MRPVTLTDLAAAARVLLAQPEALRPAAMAGLIARAEAADCLRQTSGRMHPRYGNGTLLAAALAHPAREPSHPGADEYLACLALAAEALWRHRTGKHGAERLSFAPDNNAGVPCPRPEQN